jgi:hypothetical protein
LAIASVCQTLRESSFGMMARSSASRRGSLAPITVRRITSRVSCDMRGPTGNSTATGHFAMFAAAMSDIALACRATAFAANGASINRRRSRCTSPSTTRTELFPSSPASIELASPAR